MDGEGEAVRRRFLFRRRRMDGRSESALRLRLIELVEQLLARSSRNKPVGANDHLTEIGVDSLAMVKLMLAIEAEFDIMIAPADITPENLRSVAAIAALIERQPSIAPST
jgi:acyl carrier protein